MPSDTNTFFKNFGVSAFRDVLIGLIIAAVCFISNTMINNSKDISDNRNSIAAVRAEMQSNTIIASNKSNAETEETNRRFHEITEEDNRRFHELDKKYDQLNEDINKKLDRLNDKLDNLLTSIRSAQHTGLLVAPIKD